MISKQKFSQDILYRVILKSVDNCLEYCLVNTNTDEIYLILKDDEVLK